MITIENMKIFRLVPALLLMAVVLSGCLGVSDNEATSLSRFENRIGKGTVQVIVHAEHVAAATVIPDENGNPVIESEELVLTQDQVEVLKGLLLKDDGYYFDRKKKCLFIPTMAFMFDGGKNITVMVSTICNQIKVIGKEKAIILDYDPMAEEFNAFCRPFLTKQQERL